MTDSKKPESEAQQGLDRRHFLKLSALGLGAAAIPAALTTACGGASDSVSSSATKASGIPSSSAWKFAVLGDSQWLATDDGKNPNTSAVGLYQQMNATFIAEGVKFVVQVGDLADKASGTSTEAGYSTTGTVCEDTRGLFAQALYNAGIGFFPCRGNHDSSAATATEFIAIFPQTQTGVMNDATVFNTVNSNYAGSGGYAADQSTQPAPSRSNTSTFTLGSNFSSIGAPSDNLLGLSYGFDYSNARLVFIDQFATADGNGPDGNTYSIDTTAGLQQTWISSTLSSRTDGTHAFVFSHKGLITQQHVDVLFGECPADADFAAAANTTNGTAAKTIVGSPSLNAFIRSMADNDARIYFCGHDHIHNRSIVKTTDSGTAAQVTHILTQSVSSKFYTPNENNAYGNGNVTPCTSNDAYFCGGKRQTQLSQEVYTVGFYIVTVDGANVTVDYYSAPAYPSYDSSTENKITTTPTLNWTKRESSGYSLNGQQFVLANGADLSSVADTGPSGTKMSILDGSAYNPNSDQSGRTFYCDVNTGWYTKTSTTDGDILMLWGLQGVLGSEQTGTYVLSMSYNTYSSSLALATTDSDGNWVKAADATFSGSATAVTGAWNSSYGVGTYGIDTSSKTVWAVLDYAGTFAVVKGL
nr:metallophosphoesterase [uncultured Holophaga sp.]